MAYVPGLRTSDQASSVVEGHEVKVPIVSKVLQTIRERNPRFDQHAYKLCNADISQIIMRQLRCLDMDHDGVDTDPFPDQSHVTGG